MGAAEEMVTPGEVVGKTSDVKAGRGTYAAVHNNTVYASLTGFRHTIPPATDSPDQVPQYLLIPTPKLGFHFLDSNFIQLLILLLLLFAPFRGLLLK